MLDVPCGVTFEIKTITFEIKLVSPTTCVHAKSDVFQISVHLSCYLRACCWICLFDLVCDFLPPLTTFFFENS